MVPSAVGDLAGQCERASPCHGACVEHLAQRLAVEQLLNEVVGPVLVPDIEYRRDVRVVQPGGGAGLLLEAGQPLRVGSELGWQHLDRDLALQPSVLGQPNLAHPACAELLEDEIRAELGADQRVCNSIAQRFDSRTPIVK